MPAVNFKIRSAIALSIGAMSAVSSPGFASSHREAPFISQNPSVDATDFYMFRSYEPGRENYTTMVADYIPLQDPPGGPIFFPMNQNGLYEIHVDNNGDGKEDLTFQFQFKNELKDIALPVGDKQVSIPVINGSRIESPKSPNLQMQETYTVNIVRGDRRSGQRQAVTNAAGGGTTFDKPVDNIGKKSIPDYAAYAGQHLYNVNIPGCDSPGRMFVGQRKDPFVVNVGEALDLLNIKTPAVELNPDAERSARDDLARKNVTAIAIEVPTSCLRTANEPVIGAWTTASLRQGRVINPAPDSGLFTTTKEGGAWAQVSRLAMPLVNEVVIGLKDKDKFNASKPSGDAQFLTYITNPTLAAVIESQFSSAGVKAPTKLPRNDLVTAFLTGVPGLNKPANVVPSEMMRLNTEIAPKAKGAQNRLGVIGGDTAGFPNGRRPGDDVVDVELRVLMGKLCTLNDPATFGCAPADAPSGTLQFTDGAYTDDSNYDAAFPYLRTPLAGSPQE
ncbi:DUF4331 domain-containing protein [Noviherbaspirillum aerium]|uniref:DUF4331 domain-containing protein n=1 Tax=Noviherbaspirillum aerium TaxID=2588497 RepID=UPI001CEF9267|nr:DUF4331 domain-containing protein [Noviherbaspirillum aerium]